MGRDVAAVLEVQPLESPAAVGQCQEGPVVGVRVRVRVRVRVMVRVRVRVRV